MKTLVILGMPASGKSTLARQIMKELDSWYPVVSQLCRYPLGKGLLRYHQFGDVSVLGDYSDPNEEFAGTDRLSMGVQPDAIAFIRAQKNFVNSSILVEGDRLVNAAFLRECKKAGELKIVKLGTSLAKYESRMAKQQKPPSAKWRKGRYTKVQNITREFIDNVMFSEHDVQSLVQYLLSPAMRKFAENNTQSMRLQAHEKGKSDAETFIVKAQFRSRATTIV